MVWMFATLGRVSRSIRVGGRLGSHSAAESDDADHRCLPAPSCCAAICRRRAAFAVGVGPVRRHARGRLARVPPGRVPVRGERLAWPTPVVFDHVWKKFRRGERHDSLRDLHALRWRDGRVRRGTPRGHWTRQEFWAAARTSSFAVPRGRSAGHHRSERRRQVHDAEAADAHPAADARQLRGARPRRRADRDRRRLPPRSDRPREHLPAGRDHGHAARRDRARSSTRSSSSPASPSSSTRR